MQAENRLFDDLARLAGGAFSSLSALKDEAESRLHTQVERMLANMDLVRRDEFEAVRAMAIKAREENAGLEARIEVLESRSVSIQDTARSGASIRKTRARKIASKNPKTSDAEK